MSRAEFEQLRAEWYGRLAESGFEDVERPNGRLLHEGKLRHARRRSREQIEAAAAYAELAADLLHDMAFHFPSEVARVIWEFHTAGWTVRAIASATGVHRSSVQRCIDRCRRAARVERREKMVVRLATPA